MTENIKYKYNIGDRVLAEAEFLNEAIIIGRTATRKAFLPGKIARREGFDQSQKSPGYSVALEIGASVYSTEKNLVPDTRTP